MLKINLFTSISYARPAVTSERLLSALSNYYSLGKRVVVIDKDNKIHSKNKENHCLIVAFKIVSYLLLFPLTTPCFILYLSLYHQHKVTASTLPQSDPPKTLETTTQSDKVTKVATILSKRTEESAKTNQTRESFFAFFEEFEKEILPHYEHHEQTFDKSSIHGRMHVARAVIFCEVMIRYYQSIDVDVDYDYARRVTALHDAGRKGNGEDLWEKESADLLLQHLRSKGMSEEEAFKKSRIIIKKEDHGTTLEFVIFQSADCTDIMRPCTGRGGKAGFDSRFLLFLRDADPTTKDFAFRQKLIEEAWEFISITEKIKLSQFKENNGFMNKLLKIIELNPEKFEILSSIL